MKSAITALAILAAALTPAPSSAAEILPQSVSPSGVFNNSPGLLFDGFTSPEGAPWDDPAHVWWTFDNGPTFVFDLGASWLLSDVEMSIDNNDDYLLEASLDGLSYLPLLTLTEFDGNVAPTPGGMESVSSTPGPEYVATIDFPAVMARYVRLSASGGDSLYSVGEVRFFTPVPEPASAVFAAIAAALGLGLFRRG